MSRKRWHLIGLFTAVAALAVGLVTVPANAAGGVGASLTKGSDWGSGWEGKYTITNNSGAALTSWTLEFDLANGHSIASLWDGSYTVSGQHVTVKNTWNGNLSNGASTSFGFNVKYSGTYTAPANCKINGGSCDPGGGNPTTTPTSPTTTTSNPPTSTSTSNPPTTTTTSNPNPGAKKNLGYFVQWGVYGRNYHVKNIHTSGSAAKLTHINYAFGNVTNGSCTANDDTYADYDKFYDAGSSVDGVADSWDAGALRGNFNQLRKLKKMYPGLKVLWSFGGWTWSGGFGQASKNPAAFAESCYKLIKDPRWADVFDGIDIDWEYPNACGLTCDTSGPAAIKNVAQALRTKFGSSFLVTAAITADASSGGKIDAADYGPASAYFDWYNVMTYDFFGAWAAQGPTAPHSPLTSYPGIPQQGFNSDEAIQKLKAKGVPANKLLLGIGFYGRGWTGVTQDAPGGTATGAAPGTYEAGIEDYKILKNSCPSTGTIAGTAYAKCGNNWWSYDTPATINGKMGWTKNQGLGGAFFWELSGDTSNGELVTAMRNGLN
ncbi:glycosyl hydrolase family 18 protein [Amycolatopsis regifaucium]|uniref:chitinase n=1 Tax=Amycolatopsis regifaucium TaxID=546365 RepID=A0A154MI27_9PSEU|nr:glycosyl hydrolase family 18 protein [Amycolatopsis regifaucium]KZB83780.1 chitinase [Amycolatopsis regifaucium]OKA06779.1 chitinase [Amycolatopsis regifaucium]SFH26583.1 chitinase family 18 [Amycolatopsis regifaucium]